MAMIRVYRVAGVGEGIAEVAFSGDYIESQYLKGLLDKEKGMSPSEPEKRPGPAGFLWYCRVQGKTPGQVSKEKILQLLSTDQEIELMSQAQQG